VLPELCKVAVLPSTIASFIERILDDPETQNGVGRAKIFVEDLIKQFSSIVMKLCTSSRLQPSGSDPSFLHAQNLRCTCLRLLKRFMPSPPEAVSCVSCIQSSVEVDVPRYCF
jgi:hypothetical protein